MFRSSVGVLFFVLFLSIRPCRSTEGLHANPQWPTDNEFLSVNQAVEVACGSIPMWNNRWFGHSYGRRANTIRSPWDERAKSGWVS